MVREEMAQRISIPTSILLTVISFVVSLAGAWTGIQVGLQRIDGRIDQMTAIRDTQNEYIGKELDGLHATDKEIIATFNICKQHTDEKIGALRTDVDVLKKVRG